MSFLSRIITLAENTFIAIRQGLRYISTVEKRIKVTKVKNALN